LKTHVDLIILGGGCSGLSLGMQLSKLGEKCPETVIIESRKNYVNDRTWCFWGIPQSQLRSLVSHQWDMVSVSANSCTHTVHCKSTPYEMISSKDFYDTALEEIQKNPKIKLVMNTTFLGQGVSINDNWEFKINDRLLSTKWVIDTRTVNTPQRGGALLWQSFYGQEISCDLPKFNPSCAKLMDFLKTENNRIVFLYILPTSQYRALVEITVFCKDPVSHAILKVELEQLFKLYFKITNKDMIREEWGVLPMGLTDVKKNLDINWIRVGLSSGSARSGSGFAFQRIQKWAKKCSNKIAQGKDPCGPITDKWWLKAMDNLFLKVIRANPKVAPLLFMKLFSNKENSAVIRFLGDYPSLFDCLTIIFSLPPWLFINELFRGIFYKKTSYLN
jgi:lycopene beta-cyclase